jgi:hypothetical protein
MSPAPAAAAAAVSFKLYCCTAATALTVVVVVVMVELMGYETTRLDVAAAAVSSYRRGDRSGGRASTRVKKFISRIKERKKKENFTRGSRRAPAVAAVTAAILVMRDGVGRREV